jgi:hypothetical protein
MKKVVIVAVGIFIICFFDTCKKKDSDDCPNCPKIEALLPASGRKGDTVLINGSNFSSVLTDNIVKFNGTVVAPSNMISGSTTQLKVMVPAKCGTGPVTVTLDDELYSDDGPVFTYNYVTTVTLYAGSAAGASGNTTGGTSFLNTRFNRPTQIAVDATNNVFVLDSGNATIRKLDALTGLDAVLSTGSSQVVNPTALTTDENNILYVSSYNIASEKASVYKYTPGASTPAIFFADQDTKKMHTSLCSEGSGKFYFSRSDLAFGDPLPQITHFTSKGNELFVKDHGNTISYKNGFIYQVHITTSNTFNITVFSKLSASDTTETILIDEKGGLYHSRGLLTDADNNVYISDTGNNRILKYNASGVITTLATGLIRPQGLAMDKLGNIYVAETGKNCIKKINFD